jgi:hypothetical protein
MTELKPSEILSAVSKGPAWKAMHHARMLLMLHDFLTNAENERVIQRIVKWQEYHKRKASKP